MTAPNSWLPDDERASHGAEAAEIQPHSHVSSAPSVKEPSSSNHGANIVYLAAVFTVAICLAILGTNAWLIYQARAHEIEQINSGNANLVTAVAQRIEASLSEADQVLNTLAFELERTNAGPSSMEQLQPLLVNLVTQMNHVKGLFIYAKDGRWIAHSEAASDHLLNNADREYFQFHRDNQSERIRLGPPIVSRSSGEWVIPISRRISDPDGSFQGVVLITLSVPGLQGMLETFRIGNGGAIAAFLETKEAVHVLARRPALELPTGRVAPKKWVQEQFGEQRSGTVVAVSPIDGVERFISFDHTLNFPVLVTVALSRDEALNNWRRTSYIQSIWVLVVCCAIGGFGAYLIRSIRERLIAEIGLKSAQKQLEAANRRLEQLAQHDGLTGLANRRHLDERLGHALSLALRERSDLALLMIDVDDFKSYNDAYGHLQGDQCLKAIAGALTRAATRPTDLVSRFGGEEFAILLPETDENGARQVAEAARQAVLALKLEHAPAKLGIVSISVGFAVVNEAITTASTLLGSADEALYAAKRGGKNRIHSAGGA